MRSANRLKTQAFPRGLAVAIVVCVLGLGVGLSQLLDPPERLTGQAEIIDGDTLRIGPSRIRLIGVDAPELSQSCTDRDGRSYGCGRAAHDWLVERTRGKTLLCVSTGRDRYERHLATCTVDGRDLGRDLVAAGWAVTRLDYADAEAVARAAKSGIWQGSFEAPRSFREDNGGTGWFSMLRDWFR